MNLPLGNKQYEPITWEQFRESGMLFFVNNILHAFGLAITVTEENGKIVSSAPARVGYRGFDDKSQDKEHAKIAKYLADNAINFPEEIK
ncbi:hypothetical protein SAMN05192529_13114 [Arachidicoccus rhizosphaerae]|uniref:Uncharacterized protein n=1 Tax=Arachidicoccus rhizosphaerae TaxID=551991 RepID=A0A1H4CF19_9BACT|nr:hypothetical protein [Arachidicoccus rhizosphaerae]SEA58920.1 hypothetical protein SAMN05192529_13114 [Arachidicoccus rhizosphaerae]